MPDWIAIEGCNETECILWANEPITVSGQVTTWTNSSSLTVAMHAFLGPLSLKLSLPEEVADGCQVAECPLTAGTTIDILATVNIEAPSADVNLDLPIEMSVTNENNDLVFCVRTWIHPKAA